VPVNPKEDEAPVDLARATAEHEGLPICGASMMMISVNMVLVPLSVKMTANPFDGSHRAWKINGGRGLSHSPD
jgi:hypothetical protein